MANEIKFVFTGDTADYDKAIDSIIKKANKVNELDKNAIGNKKNIVKLQKLLKDEYMDTVKNAGTLHEIEKKLKREEEERLQIAKKLSKEALTQEERQRLLVSHSRSQARTMGLKTAKLGGTLKAGALGGAGISAAVTAAAIKGTMDALGEAESVRSGALSAGKSVEQFQTEQFAKGLKRNPKEVGEAINALGLIIDENLNERLTQAGDKLKIVTAQLKNKLIPIFTFLAEQMAKFGVKLAATIQTIQDIGWKEVFFPSRLGMGSVQKMPTDAQARKEQRRLWHERGGELEDHEQAGWKAAKDKLNPTLWSRTLERNEKKLEAIMSGLLGAATVPDEAQQVPAMKVFSDSLSRIGLFKTGGESQIQTMKKSLIQLEAIKRNTTGLKEEVRTA